MWEAATIGGRHMAISHHVAGGYLQIQLQIKFSVFAQTSDYIKCYIIDTFKANIGYT